MALILGNRIKEATTTNGTGTVTLSGAAVGFQSFAAVGNGNTTYYCIASQTLNEWEVGIGTYTLSGTTLSRGTVLSSSNAGALVNFSAGGKDVFVTYPSEKSINLDASGNASAFNGVNITGIPIDNLSDVVIDTPVVNQLLGYNGTNWINTNATSAGAGAGVVLYNATPVISALGTQSNVSVATLASVPIVTAEQTATGTAASNTILFSAFISGPLNRTVIDSGIWDFSNWIGVDSATGSNKLTRQVYTSIPFVTGTVTMTGTGTTRTATASAGTPFATAVIDASATNTTASYLQTPAGLYQITARTSDTVVTIGNVPTTYTNETAVAGTVLKKLFGITTPEINNITPDYGLYEVTTTAASYAITTATGIGILGFFVCSTTNTITVTYDGTEHNTHVNTPLVNVHNDLAGLNGGTSNEYYHSTLAEYTGTGTGVFVRATNPILVTPALGTPTALVGTNITGTATAFTASNVTTNANLTGDVTSVGNATTLTNAPVIAKVLTGYVSGAGTVAATDSILQAIQKLNGNDATNANLTGGVTSVGNAATVVTNANLTGVITSVGNATSIASQTGTGTTFVVDTSPSLVTPLLGTPTSGVLTNCTGTAAGLTAGTATTVITNANLTGMVTSVGNAASLGSFTSAQLATALTDETGSGASVFATSPTLVTPLLGTPTSGVLTNCTGLPIAGGGTGAVTLAGASIATYTGTETLTNKTLTAPIVTYSVNAQTSAAYVTVASDAGAIVTVSNASANTFKLPTNASVAYAIGSTITLIQIGAGLTTISAVTPATTTVLSTGATAASPTLGQYKAATCIKTATDAWYIIGALS